MFAFFFCIFFNLLQKQTALELKKMILQIIVSGLVRMKFKVNVKNKKYVLKMILELKLLYHMIEITIKIMLEL